ncbi:hypothetical protein QU38_00835, partial [Staphylococcus aureus]
IGHRLLVRLAHRIGAVPGRADIGQHARGTGRNRLVDRRLVAVPRSRAVMLPAHAGVDVQVADRELVVHIEREARVLAAADARAPVAIGDQAVVGERADDLVVRVERDDVVDVAVGAHVVDHAGGRRLVLVALGVV